MPCCIFGILVASMVMWGLKPRLLLYCAHLIMVLHNCSLRHWLMQINRSINKLHNLITKINTTARWTMQINKSQLLENIYLMYILLWNGKSSLFTWRMRDLKPVLWSAYKDGGLVSASAFQVPFLCLDDLNSSCFCLRSGILFSWNIPKLSLVVLLEFSCISSCIWHTVR